MSVIQEVIVPHTIESYEQNGRYYLKSFLLDSSVAGNNMGVVSEYIPKHINKFVGTPVILTPDFYHPHEFDHYVGTGLADKDVPELKRLQLPYSIGTIISVDTNSTNILQGGQENNTRYSAILEITDPKAISAFKNGKIPMYVSPSIYRINSSEPFNAITDYEPLHIAVVNNPAYGFHKANIRSQCQGDITHCSRMLAQASNGYCVENKLNELNNVFSGSGFDTVNSSYTKSSLTNDIRLSENNNNAVQSNSESNATQQQVEQQPTIEQKIQEEQQKTEIKQSKAPISTPIQQSQSVQPEPANINPPGTDEQRDESSQEEEAKAQKETPCAKAKAEYESKLVELENEIKSFREFKVNYEKTAKQAKIDNKRAKIENIVPANYADSEDERKKAVESLMNVADDQLDIILNSFVIPATRNIKQGGLRQRPKVTDFVKEDTKVAQASMAKVIDSKSLENLESVLSFAGSIVPKKTNNEGGIA